MFVRQLGQCVHENTSSRLISRSHDDLEEQYDVKYSFFTLLSIAGNRKWRSTIIYAKQIRRMDIIHSIRMNGHHPGSFNSSVTITRDYLDVFIYFPITFQTLTQTKERTNNFHRLVWTCCLFCDVLKVSPIKSGKSITQLHSLILARQIIPPERESERKRARVILLVM